MKKKFFLTIALLFTFTCILSQNPVLHWRFSNVQYLPGDSISFDVQMKCNVQGTFHSSTQVYFNYNPEVFGESIVGNNNVTWTPLELLEGDVAGAEKYSIVNCTDNTPSRLGIVLEANFLIPDPVFINEVDTTWKDFLNFKIKVQDPYKPVNIEFEDEYGGVGYMNGGQYYVDLTHPIETKYGYPPIYEGIYENDLLNYFPIPLGWLSGLVTDSVSGYPIAGALITADALSATTSGTGEYIMPVSIGTHIVTAEAQDYKMSTVTGVLIAEMDTTTVDFALTPLKGSLGGFIYDATNNNPVDGATIGVGGQYTGGSSPDGSYEINDIFPGIYVVTVTHPDYEPWIATGIEIFSDSITEMNAFLQTDLPVAHWRFSNVQYLPGDSISFDVQMKCNVQGTFHSSTQVYFNYNPEVFGESI
ncbi:MAG: carboxypeptidase-like regulatory domain-containing protein, partial [Bacteroidales bacterium]|nr:carboxypeptidase-like regulatory domain-containing protein [Bacteroidales bacterium]